MNFIPPEGKISGIIGDLGGFRPYISGRAPDHDGLNLLNNSLSFPQIHSPTAKCFFWYTQKSARFTFMGSHGGEYGMIFHAGNVKDMLRTWLSSSSRSPVHASVLRQSAADYTTRLDLGRSNGPQQEK